MIVTDNFFEIDDQIEKLVQAILNSESVENYKRNKKLIYKSSEVLLKKKQFMQAKEAFERVESFGAYAPDFKSKRMELRKAKRKLDLDDRIANFRVSETEIQTTLDAIGIAVAKTISKDIKVDAGNPFFTKGKHTGCGGGCHHAS